MKSAKYLFPVFLFTSSLFAQQLSHPVMVSRDDAFLAPRPFSMAVDTIDVLAALVQFQIDADTRTNGNGQFDLSTPATAALDAPPHNRQYFLDHLTLLTNYYRKVSKGKTVIRATLIDTVYTLSSQMQRYSPPKNGPNTVVGDLARDTWQKVDSSGKVQDFSKYECFVVFHAGVGRDVDVVSTIGFDPTPFDIPSLYLGLNAFKTFYGTSYQGIPLRNGLRITNTIIMPETETRELPATPTNFLLRLGINGLLCSSVGNYLGLPDLFDTNTGRSGIGRFGLMDGQAIFSFAGAFPPEPSAWEKYWLGWIQPTTIFSGTSNLGIPAASVDSARVYRIPISGSEYFLVENRNRDWARNGQRVTTFYGGILRQQTFARDTTGFNAFDLSGIAGNVIDVEDFDWSLPGGVGTSGTFYDGGILIWHIDETVIAQGLATNGVNGNPNRRGVDVEEADGSQDIGQSYGLLDPGSGSEEGTIFDFWYRGNAAPVYRNEFSATSYPNSSSNSGANSHITIKDISTRGPHMTVRVIVGDEVSLLVGFPKSLPNQANNISLTVADLNADSKPDIIVSSNQTRVTRIHGYNAATIYAWDTEGAPVFPNFYADGTFWRHGPFPDKLFINSVAVRDLNNDGVVEVVDVDIQSGGVPYGFLHAFSARLGSDSLASRLFESSIWRQPKTAATISDSFIVVGARGGRVLFFSFGGRSIDSTRKFNDSSTVVGISRLVEGNSFVATTNDGAIGIVKPNIALDPSQLKSIGKGIVGFPSIGLFGGQERIAFVTSDGYLYLIDKSLSALPGFPLYTGASIVHSPVLADIDGDGIRDIVVFAANKIYAYNYAGASLDNFPKLVPSSNSITSNPVVADVDGDRDVDIVAVTSDGLVVAYDKNGTMAKGFPLQAGTGSQSVAAFAFSTASLSVTNVGLAVASSDDGSVTAWKTGSVGANLQPNLPWPQYQHDAQHTGLATEPLTGTPISSAFFPKERAYNWPNPVYEGRTFIRYFVKENATVKIKIFDLAGDLVTELNGPGVAGVDNEVEWNVAQVQSGVYLARIEANAGGKSESAIVKVAVVK